MQKFIKAAISAALVSGSMLAAPAFAEGDLVKLMARLSANGGSQGSGSFVAVIDVENSRLCYDLSAANIGNATAARISERGSTVVELNVAGDQCTGIDASLVSGLANSPSSYSVDVVGDAGEIDGQVHQNNGSTI